MSIKLNNSTQLMTEKEREFNSLRQNSPFFKDSCLETLEEKGMKSNFSPPTYNMEQMNPDFSFEAITIERQSDITLNPQEQLSLTISSLQNNSFSNSPKNQSEETSIHQKHETQFKISQILTDDRLKCFQGLDLKYPNVYESEVLILSKYNRFEKRIMNVYGSIRIEEKLLYLKDIRKITVEPEIVKGKAFKMVLRYKTQDLTFGVQLKRELYLLPQHYIWLAKIINSQMIGKGHHLSSTMDQPLGWNSSFCEGQIFKQSKYLKKWKKRYVVITPQGLYSYKTLLDENPTIFISVRDIKALSTQFDTHYQHLIIRLTYSEDKVQFAIPIQDYCEKVEKNWLFAFYRLLMEFKYHIKIA